MQIKYNNMYYQFLKKKMPVYKSVQKAFVISHQQRE